MTNEFKIVAGFLERFSVEVEGREGEAPSQAVLDRLQRFARGDLDEVRREELIRTLHEHRTWVVALATEVENLRAPRTAES